MDVSRWMCLSLAKVGTESVVGSWARRLVVDLRHSRGEMKGGNRVSRGSKAVAKRNAWTALQGRRVAAGCPRKDNSAAGQNPRFRVSR